MILVYFFLYSYQLYQKILKLIRKLNQRKKIKPKISYPLNKVMMNAIKKKQISRQMINFRTLNLLDLTKILYVQQYLMEKVHFYCRKADQWKE